MKIVVAGCRDFDLPAYMWACLDSLLPAEGIEIVSGCAQGADWWGERYAEAKGFQVAYFEADWHKYKRSAGAIRNKAMCEYCDGVIVFWDGVSSGTFDMLTIAREAGKLIEVFTYNNHLLRL